MYAPDNWGFWYSGAKIYSTDDLYNHVSFFIKLYHVVLFICEF